jgi:FKBP-type peptidyl-prolyl cis-trans isomerase
MRMKRSVLAKVSVGISALFLLTVLGVGCASEEQIKAQREAAELAAKKAEDAAARAEAAANRAEAAAKQSEAAAQQANAAAAKCEKTFEKGLQK